METNYFHMFANGAGSWTSGLSHVQQAFCHQAKPYLVFLKLFGVKAVRMVMMLATS